MKRFFISRNHLEIITYKTWGNIINRDEETIHKKVGIIIATDDPETCWVAVRYATFHLLEYQDVKIYLVDSGLKCAQMLEEKHNIVELIKSFTLEGGQVFVCQSRENFTMYLTNHFTSLLNKKDLASISNDDKFQSVMTKHVYIRAFKEAF